MISNKQIVEEYAKCYHDKTRIYMIENYFSTFDATNNNTVPFILFPKQKEYCTNLSKYVNNVTSKYRQSGITTISCAFFSAEIALAEKGKPERILLIANNLKQANENLVKMKEFLLQVPRWFWGEDYYGTPEKEAKTIFTKANESKLNLVNGCEVFSRSAGPNSSRGCSAISRILFDESAFIENPAAITSAISTAATSAKTITYVSTPNGRDLIYFPIYDSAKKGTDKSATAYKLTEFKWYQDPRYNKNLKWTRTSKEDGKIETYIEPTLDNSGGVQYNELHWEEMIQQGYKPYSTWYDKMCSYYNHNRQQIAQELDVSFLGSAGTVIDEEDITRHTTINTREPIYSDNFFPEAWVYREPIENHKYLMCIDVATGSGADSSVISILDVDYIDENGESNIEQVFEYQGKIQGDILGELAYKYGKYYGNALAVVDCQGGTGDPCVLKLQEMNYPNLYYDDPNLKNVTIENQQTNYNENSDKKMPGFRSSSTRLQQFINLEKMLRFNEIIPRSKRFTQELTTFIWKNGRPDHQTGFHDDTITAMAMGLFVLQFSFKKLQSVKEKNKVILSSMILMQNVITGRTEYKTNPDKKIAMPFYTTNGLDRNALNRQIGNNQIKAMNAMLFKGF